MWIENQCRGAYSSIAAAPAFNPIALIFEWRLVIGSNIRLHCYTLLHQGISPRVLTDHRDAGAVIHATADSIGGVEDTCATSIGITTSTTYCAIAGRDVGKGFTAGCTAA